MATSLALYETPADSTAFDKYYAATQIPLAKKIPGLRSYRISNGVMASPAGASGVHLVATLTFDSMAALQDGLGSPEAPPRPAISPISPPAAWIS